MINSLLRVCAWFAIWTTFSFGALQVNASDTGSSCTAANPAVASTSEPRAEKLELKLKNARKYDVSRLGQRKVSKGINLYSLEKERALGARMATAIDMETIPASDNKIKDYLAGIAQKIVRNSDAQFPFTIKVIDSRESTIFALPGGLLYIDVALLSDVDSEAELAGLMAHEIAHAVARHATRLETRRFTLNVLLSFPITQLIGPWALPVRQLGLAPIEKKFSRDSEFEADLLGIEYQYAAGYDPQAYLEVLERLGRDEIEAQARASSRPKSSFLALLNQGMAHSYSDYPPTEKRIQRLQSEISALLPCRENYVVDTDEFQSAKAQLRAASVVLQRRHAGDNPTGPVLERHSGSH